MKRVFLFAVLLSIGTLAFAKEYVVVTVFIEAKEIEFSHGDYQMNYPSGISLGKVIESICVYMDSFGFSLVSSLGTIVPTTRLNYMTFMTFSK